MQFDPRELRKAFGSFMTGVTVVTTINEQGEPVGFTANSFSSVSMNPPLISVCPAKSLSSYDSFKNATYFAINILAEGQEDVSNIFASSVEDRFSKVNWTKDDKGVPILTDALTSFSCEQYQNINAGDHIILIGKVIDFNNKQGHGLGYTAGSYFSLGLEREAAAIQEDESQANAGLIVEHKGKILFTKKDGKLSLPTTPIKKGENATEAAESYIDKNKLDVLVGTVYSIFDNKVTHVRSTYYRCDSVSNIVTKEDYGFYNLKKVLKENDFQSDIKTMLERYLFESKAGVYGIYVGDHEQGKIHTII